MNRRLWLVVVVAGLVTLGLLLWERLAPAGLPNFSAWEAGEERKTRFFDYLEPLLKAENARILTDRARLQQIRAELSADAAPAGGEATLGWGDRRWLRWLADDYLVAESTADETPGSLASALLLRVDAVPASLGLAQAAKESGWGTSRFAVEGYALFGQRCFERGCGMVPADRTTGLSHEVRSFATPAAAVASYVKNLNTHPDYETLRRLRARLREAGSRVTGFALAGTLESYSERRDDYIQEVQQLIRYNELGPVPERD